VLGKGATGAVYQGVNKHNGEPVAVKTFNQLSHMRPFDVQMREFEVLEKVKHENIVKLLAIEEEHESRGKVSDCFSYFDVILNYSSLFCYRSLLWNYVQEGVYLQF